MSEWMIRSADDLSHVTPFCKSEPGIPSSWTPSYLHTLSVCPRRFYLEKLEGWHPKGRVALRFGQEFHSGVEEYKRRIVSGQIHDDAVFDTIKSLYHRCFPWDSEGDTARTLLTLVRAVLWFIDSEEHSTYAPLILADGKPALELDWELQLPRVSPDGQPYILRSHFDEICQDSDDKIFILTKERKTTKMSLGSGYYAQFKPDTQSASFSLAGKVVFSFRSLDILYEAIQTMVEGTRFGTHLVHYNDDELDEFVQDVCILISQAESYANAGYWPMNRASCDTRGGCPFRDPCSHSPSSRHVILQSDFHKTPSNWEIAEFSHFAAYFTHK